MHGGAVRAVHRTFNLFSCKYARYQTVSTCCNVGGIFGAPFGDCTMHKSTRFQRVQLHSGRALTPLSALQPQKGVQNGPL